MYIFYNFPSFEGIKIPSVQKFCIVKRSVFQRGIRKKVKIEVSIKVVQVWLSLGERHHRPKGTAGTNFSIQEEMGLAGSTKKYDRYKAIQVHDHMVPIINYSLLS
jgi:hypothetical protein